MNKDTAIYREVSAVAPGSIAEELELLPGDILLSIDGEPVRDIFDYRTRILTERLTIEIRRADGEILEADIEKDEEDDLGLSFTEPLLDACSSCHNGCVFCFIDQLPKGLRKSLYFKDDDLRMSFLTGNYVTLTNLSEDEFERILSYRLSPMNVSVHATDPEVRRRMMKNRFAGNIMDRLLRITESGIALNCQIVLCPGLNDGEVLEQTLLDLHTLNDNLRSIAVVPVGITRFRDENRLTELESYSRESSLRVLRQVRKWQKFFLSTRGERIFYAADEFYLRAECPIPSARAYEGFPQLENGVGMIRDFRTEMKAGIRRRKRKILTESTKDSEKRPRVLVLTGIDAHAELNSFADELSVLYNINLDVRFVVNRFFGERITVTGLLTGGDLRDFVLRARAAGEPDPDCVFLSSCMLKADEDVFLDDMTLTDLQERIQIPIVVSPAAGGGLLETLDQYTGRFLGKSAPHAGAAKGSSHE